VEDYQDRFQALLPRAGRLEEAQRVQLFTGGLLPPLSLQVQMQNPQSLVTAMSLARQFELMEQCTAAQTKAPGRGILQAPGPRQALSQPPASRAAASLVLVDGRPVKRLTQAEQDERRRLGLCFNCDEKYSRGHNKVCKRLFLLDCVVDDDDDTDAAEDTQDLESPVFSLHAVAGVLVADTMQVQVAVGATPFTALLDSGSTHSFIAEEAARHTGLPVQPRPRMTATVANGEKVACPGVIRQATLSIDGTIFTVDLFVIPLAGYDMVLGTQWMASLGPIVWDFAERTMSFQYRGRNICWAGVPSSPTPRIQVTTAASESLLDELLADFGDVFAEPKGLPP